MVTYPKDWLFVPVGECVTEKLSYGVNAPAIQYNSNLPSYIRITDITDDGRYDDKEKNLLSRTKKKNTRLNQVIYCLQELEQAPGNHICTTKKMGTLYMQDF